MSATPLVLPVLREAQFRTLWIGEAISLAGSWSQLVATAWLAWQFSHSPTIVGVVAAATFLPSLLLSNTAGALADRWPRRTVLFTTQATAILPAATLGLLLATGMANAASLIVLAAASGVAQAFYLPARLALIPDLLPPGLVPAAAGLTTATVAVARLSGSAIGAISLATVGPAWCCWINALSYIAVLISLVLIRPSANSEPSTQRTPGGSRQHRGSRMQLLRERRDLRVPLLTVAAFSLLAINNNTVAPLIAVRLHAGAGVTGLLLGASAVGAFAASALLAWRGNRSAAPRLVPFALITSAAIVGLGLAPTLLAAVIAIAIAGAGYARLLSIATARLQTAAPPAMRGAVMGMHATAVMGVAPAGNLFAGVAAQLVGVNVSVAIGGVLAMLITLLATAGATRVAPAAAPTTATFGAEV